MEREEAEMSEEMDALNTWWTLVHSDQSEDTNELIDDAQASITVCKKEGRHPVKIEIKPALTSKTKSRRRGKSLFPVLTRTKSSTKSVSWDDEDMMMKKTHLEEAEKLRLDLVKKYMSREVSLFDIGSDGSKEEDRNDSISITTEYVHKVEGGGDDEKRCGGLGLSSAGLESVWMLFCAAADGVDDAINNMGNNDAADIVDTSTKETETISKDESQKDLHAFSTELANAWSTLCQALPDTSAEETETVVKDESQKNLQEDTSIKNAKSEGFSLDVSAELTNAWSTLCQALPGSKNDDGLLKDSTSAAEVEKDTNEKYWRATVDSTTNKTYYYNKKTREVSWTKPEGFGHYDEHWRSAKDLSTGKTYYYHKKTKEVSWTKPDGFKERKRRV